MSAYNQERRDFEFKPGPVFANIVLGDEINRASPKTQSALLESMEERQVTVDGTTYALQEPFMVIATQNPVEMEGTYPLPEAQRDRFTARISLGYPLPAAERDMLDTHGGASPLDQLRPVARASDVHELVLAVRKVLVSDQVKDYIISLANATRTSPELRLGQRHEDLARAAPRRVPAGRPAPAPRQPGLGRAGRAGLRDPRRCAAAGQAGARPPAAAHRGGHRGAAPARAGGGPDRRPAPPAAAVSPGRGARR